MSLRPPVVQTVGVNTTAQWWWGSKIQRNAAEFDASVYSVRLQQPRRIGDINIGGSSIAAERHSGFGPFPPIVVGAKINFGGPSVYRTRPLRVVLPQMAAKSFYSGPRVLIATAALGGILIQTVASPKDARKARSRLRPPVVVTVPAVTTYGGPRVRLVGPRDRVPDFLSQLSPPAVVGAPPNFGGPRVKLVAPRSQNPPVRSRLRPPTVVLAPAVFFGPRVVLDRIRPVATHPSLHPPVVVFTAVELSGPETTLAYSVRGKPRSRLAPPTDLVDAADLGFVRVHLAYSLRGKPRSRLSAPVVVFQAIELSGPEVTLAPQPKPIAKSHLSPQGIAAIPFADTTLLVHLAYSVRGNTRSTLRAPTVIGSSIRYGRGSVYIVRQYRIRRETHWRLQPPTVVIPATVSGALRIRLAPSVRGAPNSFLRPPPALGESARPTVVTLAPSAPPRLFSRLRPPVVVRPAPIFFVAKPALVQVRPPRTHSFLRPPTDLVDQQDIGLLKTTLVRIRPAAVHSILREPIVVGARVAFGPPAVRLVRIRPPAVHSRLRPPTDLVDQQDIGLLQTTLVRTPPVPVHSRLRPPAVVAVRSIGLLQTTLVRIRPPAVHSVLREPAVVFPAEFFTGPHVHLSYSRRGRPVYRLKLTEITIPICFGTVTGFDFAPTVCGDDEGPGVTGDDAASEACGDEDGPTAEGASAPRGSVTGGDARREGC